jgi:hypothetical protein
MPTSAQASSFGCTTAGSGLPWYGLNSAYTCIDVGGAGDTVWSVQAEWFGIGTICNYRFHIWFSEINGRVYENDYSRAHVGCRGAAGNWTRNFGSRVPWGGYAGIKKKTGEVCVQVLQNGRADGGAACESIHP